MTISGDSNPTLRSQDDVRTFLRKGDKGELVKHLQRLLQRRGFPVPSNAEFDDKTELGVTAFQCQHFDKYNKPLRQDGIVDETTWWSLTHKQNDFIYSEFSSAEQLTQANVDGTTQTTHTFHDVINRLDVAASLKQKIECMRIPLVAFGFHSAIRNGSTSLSLVTVLSDAKHLLNGVSAEQTALVEDTRKSLRVIGDAASPSRRIVDLIRNWGVFEEPFAESELRCLPPLLLVNLVFDVYEREDLDADDMEHLGELVDRATLAAVKNDITESLSVLGEDRNETAQSVDRALIASTIERNPLSIPNARYYAPADSLKIPDELWILLLALNSDRPGSSKDLVVPFGVLNSLLSDHLHAFFSGISRNRTSNAGLKRFIGLCAEGKKDWAGRKLGFEAFLPSARLLLTQRRSSLSVAAMTYGGTAAASFLPHINIVDLRPLAWARDAMLVSSELRATQAQYSAAAAELSEKPKAGAEEKRDVIALGAALGRATANWYAARSKLDVLTRLVEGEGYKLLSRESAFDENGTKVIAGNFYQLIKQKTVTWEEVVDHSRTEYRQEIRERRVCPLQPSPFDFGCKWVRYPVNVPFTVKWTTTERRERVDETPFRLEDDLVEEYLKQPMDLGTLRGTHQTSEKELLQNIQAFQTALGLPPSATREEAEKLLVNENKTVHRFFVQNGKLIDVNGRSLDEVLLEIERLPNREVELVADKVTISLPERSFRLCLLPEAECGVSGEITWSRYFAVHNPILQRSNPTAPAVFLVETYRHSVTHEPGHWLGALAYTDSLFPGESRKLKLSRQTKMSLNESGSSSSKQSSSRRNVSDIFSQVRAELDDRKQSAASTNWNASVSGGATFGAGSASASASAGGTSSNSSDVTSKNLNDRVDKILSESSQGNEVEVKSSKVETTESSTASEEEREFANVNQAQPLTFKFFQLAHLFTTNVSLWDVRIVVKVADELIPGVKIPKLEVFALEELNNMMMEIDEEDRKELIEDVSRIIDARYGSRVIRLEDGSYNTWTGIDNVEGKYTLAKGNVLSRRSSYVNSGSMFVEAEVGGNPGTEAYVNDVRRGETEKTEALTRRMDAEAKAIGAGNIVLPSDSEHVTIYVNAEPNKAGTSDAKKG